LPSAARTDFGKCAIVRFRFAADAAFLIFFLAAVLCFVEAICIFLDDLLRVVLNLRIFDENCSDEVQTKSKQREIVQSAALTFSATQNEKSVRSKILRRQSPQTLRGAIHRIFSTPG
jgi:hypothetical protein